MLTQSWQSQYFRVALIAVIASILLIAGIVTVGPLTASADKLKVTEEYGAGVIQAGPPVTTSEVISDCGDADPSTNVLSYITTNENNFTGIIQGTASARTRGISNTCVTGRNHADFQTLLFFEDVTIAGRTGGAVIERVGTAETVGGIRTTDARLRILCGTGDLNGIHGEGITLILRDWSYALWAHFGHNHDVGYDFLCEGIGN